MIDNFKVMNMDEMEINIAKAVAIPERSKVSPKEVGTTAYPTDKQDGNSC